MEEDTEDLHTMAVRAVETQADVDHLDTADHHLEAVDHQADTQEDLLIMGDTADHQDRRDHLEDHPEDHQEDPLDMILQ